VVLSISHCEESVPFSPPLRCLPYRHIHSLKKDLEKKSWGGGGGVSWGGGNIQHFCLSLSWRNEGNTSGIAERKSALLGRLSA